MDEQKIGIKQYENFFSTVKKQLEELQYKTVTEYMPPVDNLPARLKVIPGSPKDTNLIVTLIESANLPVYVDRRVSYFFLDLDEEAFFQYRAAVLNQMRVVEEEHTTTTVTSVKRRTSDSRTSLFSLTDHMVLQERSLVTSEQKTFRAFMCMLRFADLAVESSSGHSEAIKIKGCIDRIIQFMYVLDDFKIEYLYHEDVLHRVNENHLSVILENSCDYTNYISIEMREAADPIKHVRTPIDYRDLTSEGKKRILLGYTSTELLTNVIQEIGLIPSSDESQQKIIENIANGVLIVVDPKDPFILEGATVKPKPVVL